MVLKPSLRLCPRPEGKPGPVEKYVWGGKAKVGLGPSPPPKGEEILGVAQAWKGLFVLWFRGQA